MAKLRKFAAYQNLERPYTRVSKYTTKNFVRGGFPHMKVIKFVMGSPNKEFDTVVVLNATRAMNIRHNAIESARMTSNRLLERNLVKDYLLKIRIYTFLAAGADRLSTGMKKSYGKSIGSAARVKEGQTLMEVRVNKANVKVAKEALKRASKKFPCSCKINVLSE